MSRFANPAATDRMSLGACQCPGTPHDDDWIEMRTELGMRDVLAIATGDSVGTLELLIVDWNLHDHDGTKAEVSRANIERLYADVFDRFNEWTEQHLKAGTLPNVSAVRSASSSRANGSRTRARPTAR